MIWMGEAAGMLTSPTDCNLKATMEGNRPKDPARRNLLILGALLVLPALLLNLGDQSLIGDEGIRSLVAFEMLESGDFIQPTLNGEHYYKKPPLYNWILASLFTLSGTANEWTARIPTVLFLLLFTFLVYRTVRRATSDRDLALLGAAMTLTCGRILFWDSFLGLIDMSFSALVFGLFAWLWSTSRREQWRAYFLGSWLLTAVAFLLKGLPGLVFQVISVGGHLVLTRRWRRLFHPMQFVGAALFLLLMGSYYYLLLRDVPMDKVFGTLFRESAMRTPVDHGLWKTLGHIPLFPLEMTYHFLPWSLLLLFVFPLRGIKERLADPFLRFLGLMFAVNIPVYWLSPGVHPRYILMLAPLVFTVGYGLYRQAPETAWHRRLVEGLFHFILMALPPLSLLPLFLPQTSGAPWLWAKVAALMALTTTVSLLARGRKDLLFVALAVQLLVVRLGFDWFVIPDRVSTDSLTPAREDARRVGNAYRGRELYHLDTAALETPGCFYLSTARGGITTVWRDTPIPGAGYLIAGDTVAAPGYRVLDTLRVRRCGDCPPHFLLIEYPAEAPAGDTLFPTGIEGTR
jgi:4-amino-4-deoxy-L-arabinose transferase-like glycosyltransferase